MIGISCFIIRIFLRNYLIFCYCYQACVHVMPFSCQTIISQLTFFGCRNTLKIIYYFVVPKLIIYDHSFQQQSHTCQDRGSVDRQQGVREDDQKSQSDIDEDIRCQPQSGTEVLRVVGLQEDKE
jgi:hypothetical protein